jgi:hypothetical protein
MVIAVLSGVIWYLWMSNIEYVNSRGAVAGMATAQTILVIFLVHVLRDLRLIVRWPVLFVIGQFGSIALDWAWTLILDTERATAVLSKFQLASCTIERGLLIAFGAVILLGGVQALVVDGAWTLSRRRLR